MAELQHLTLAQILALAGGSGFAGAGAPAKRGPGRPKKAASGGVSARPAGKSGRLRRSAEDLKRVATKIVALLNDHSDGLSSEEIQKSLGLQKKEIVGPIALGLEQGSLRKTGERRGTRYFTRKK